MKASIHRILELFSHNKQIYNYKKVTEIRLAFIFCHSFAHKFNLQYNNVLFLGQGLVYNCIIRNLNCQSEVVMLNWIAFTLQNSISICLPCYTKMTVKYIERRLFAKTNTVSSRKSAHIWLSKTDSIYLPLCHLSQAGKLAVYPFLCIAFLI